MKLFDGAWDFEVMWSGVHTSLPGSAKFQHFTFHFEGIIFDYRHMSGSDPYGSFCNVIIFVNVLANLRMDWDQDFFLWSPISFTT